MIKDILDTIHKYGITGFITVLITFFLYLLSKTTWFTSFMNKLSDSFLDRVIRKKTKNDTGVKIISESDILNHDIFSYIDFWMYSKIPTFQFSTDYRTIVFRKYLVIYLKKHKDNIKKYVTDKNFETMDSSQMWNSFLSLTNEIIYDYEKEMETSGIPKIIIEKMKAKNNDTISLTIDLIEGVCNSQFYESEKNLLKIYSILNIMLSILENTISNSEHICNSINGQLKGMKFYDGGKEYREP